ncbi:ATP-binding protein [Spirosoma spitsbergense]|uniref:ATP-binding protein n=1 Tax=Spirosoma spitsbergense TaxID=431554 RepID=UPI0003800915|nr:ATP-binding protein [Spirosoma spitsbergense]
MKDLNAFAQQLAARMEQRLTTPPEEQYISPFMGSRAPDFSEGDAPSLDALIQQAEERAAVSGRFDPADVVTFVEDTALRQQILSRLAPTCTIETIDGKVQWLLTQLCRKETLKGMAGSGRLASVLNQSLPVTDTFGMMLRAVLREGERVSLLDRSTDELQAISAASDALNDTGLPQPDSAQIWKLLLKDTLLADYEVLLNDQFVGRQEELNQLTLFVQQGSNPAGYGGWSSLVLTGVGGVGKSTLLAKFAEEAVALRIATLVLLDFDRPGIDPNDRYWLEMEMTRQVGLQFPDLAESLRKLRANWREQRQADSPSNAYAQSSATKSFTESVEVARGQQSVVSDMRQLVQEGSDADERDVSLVAEAATVTPQRPYLLVLDTFEEVMQQDLAGSMLEWLVTIGDALRPVPLLVIFSGRLFGDDQDELKNWGVSQFIELTELDRRQAEQMLLNLGVAKPMAKRLVNSGLFPRRPLELRLLAKVVTREPASSIDELEAEISQGGPAAKELFTGIVYKRLLQRIDDKDEIIRELAYPGLVLRYVTPALLEQVLVPALDLDLKHLSPADVLNKLASYGWLASRRASEDPQEVWHRRDLRQSILQLIQAQEPDKARRISEAAIAFFSGKGEKEWAESVYHRLLLMQTHQDGDSVELADLKQASPYIKGDVTDLPRPAQVLFRFATEGRVQSADVDCLPNRYLGGAYRKTGRRLVNSREFTKARQLLKRGQEAGIAYEQPDTKPDRWEIDALLATASWTEMPGALAKIESGPANASLVGLATWLYPAILILPDLRLPNETTHRLAEAAKSEKTIANALTGPDGTLLITYLSLGLVLQYARTPLDADSRERVGRIVAQAWPQPVIHKSARLTRKLILMSFLSDQPAEWFSMAPSTLRLNADWINQLARVPTTGASGDTAPALVQETGNALFTGLNGKQRTVRRLLRTMDALYKERNQWHQVHYRFVDFQNADDCLALFRGPDSEFRDPCRFALLEAYPDADSRRQLGSLFQSVVGLDLIDLTPDVFAESLAPDPEHGLESYIELVDRTWQLGELLRRAVGERPQAPKLKQVLNAYERWDTSFRAVVHAFYESKKS